jgi:G:T/U-mismatch repair DNA glycosylase
MAYREQSMWTVLAKVVNTSHHCDSPRKYVLLRQAILAFGIAIWDVLSNVHHGDNKKGKRQSETPNDVSAVLEEHPSIRAVCLVDAKAYHAFRRHGMKGESSNTHSVSMERTVDLVVLLPTSSGRNRMPLEEKVVQRKTSLQRYGCGSCPTDATKKGWAAEG